MRSALSISRNTNLVFPRDVGPAIMAVHGCTNGNMSTPRYDFRLSRRVFVVLFIALSLPPSLPPYPKEGKGGEEGRALTSSASPSSTRARAQSIVDRRILRSRSNDAPPSAKTKAAIIIATIHSDSATVSKTIPASSSIRRQLATRGKSLRFNDRV